MADDQEITAKFHVADLQGSWDENAKPSEHYAALLIGAKTDLGCVRENNEDKFEFYIPSDPDKLAKKGCLVAVSDGMGGHAAGQIASEMALKTLTRHFYEPDHADVEASLRWAVRESNSVVHNAASVPGRSGMGCTLTAASVRGSEVVVAQVGDSRFYHYRDGVLEQITTDHTWVEEQVSLGVLTREEAEYSPFKNIITRSIGTQPETECDIFKLDVKEGDCLLLCSDGLTGVVSDDRILEVMQSSGPAESCELLVEMALTGGGPDNVTVLIAQILGIDRLTKRKNFFPGFLKGN